MTLDPSADHRRSTPTPTAVGDTSSAPETPPELFAGPGEVRARCRALDWAATPLGPVERWPASLRTAVDRCLGSPFPIRRPGPSPCSKGPSTGSRS